MDASSVYQIYVHPQWRSPRSKDRRILLLPDGNHRKGASGRNYAAGAANVVACAEYLARRGDIGSLLVSIASRQNIDKRPDAFFAAVLAQFSRLRSEIVERSALVRANIRCGIHGDLSRLRRQGGARSALCDAIERVSEATNGVLEPRMHLGFCVDYSDDLSFEGDVDLVLRTGAEEMGVLRPAFHLPAGAPCIVTTKLWPNLRPEELSDLVDRGLEGQRAHFAPGYSLDFVEAMARGLSRSQIPAPMQMTIPVCASKKTIVAMLEELYADPRREPRVISTYVEGPARYSHESHESHEFGPAEEAWYALRLFPAARFNEFAGERVDAIVAPGQPMDRVSLCFAGSSSALVCPCPATVEDVFHAARRAIRFPIAHVLLQGADRSEADGLSSNAPWPVELIDMMQKTSAEPSRSVESIVEAALPSGAEAEAHQELLIQGISARVLGSALTDGLLLSDSASREGDRNYAYTGAAMMVRVPDEAKPSGHDWEPAAEVSIKCMLALSAGDNGVFDRVFPSESADEWRRRLESAASYLEAIARGDHAVEAPTGRGMHLLSAIGEQWKDIFERYAGASPALVLAFRDALVRHYRANLKEHEPGFVKHPLVNRLGIGGPPRREALREIEARYAKNAPGPVGEKIRSLLRASASEPARFSDISRELTLLIHILDTAHGMGVEVLFLCSALPTPVKVVTKERLQALVEIGKLADATFRLANDLSSLGATGEDRDAVKESCLTILIPKGVAASRKVALRDRAWALGSATLGFLKGHLEHAMGLLRKTWPSMGAKVERAVRIGGGVYERAHYNSMEEKEILALVSATNQAVHGRCTAPKCFPQEERTAPDPLMKASADYLCSDRTRVT